MKALSKTKILFFFIALSILSYTFGLTSYSAKPVGADVTIDQVTTFSITESSVRLIEPMGLQFTAEISNDEYSALKSTYGNDLKFGMLITTDEHLENSGLTKPVFGDTLVSGQSMIDVKNTVLLDGTDVKFYNAAVTNIQEKNYYKDFVAVGYIEATVDGQVLYEYTQAFRAKYFSEIAESVNDTEYVYTETQSKTFNDVIMSVVNNSDKQVQFTFPQSDEVFYAGDKVDIKATFEGVDLPVTFTSSDQTVLREREQGIIAVKPGSATISAIVGECCESAEITVLEDEATNAYLLGAYVECADSGVYAEIERKVEHGGNVKPHVVISGKSGLADSRIININTNKSLKANTAYTLYMRVKAFASRTNTICIGYSFSLRTNFITKWKDLTTLSGFSHNGLGDGDENKYYPISYEITPTDDVDKLQLIVNVHGSRFNWFNFEITDVYVVEKSTVTDDLCSANSLDGVQKAFNRNDTEYYFTANDKEVVTENSVGITFIKHTADTAEHAIFSLTLDKGLTQGKEYTLKFKIIDWGVPKNKYNQFYFTLMGVNGLPETYGSAPVAMEVYKQGGYMTTTVVNGVNVYEFSITSTATKTVDNAVLQIYLGLQLTQKCTFTDIKLVESAS